MWKIACFSWVLTFNDNQSEHETNTVAQLLKLFDAKMRKIHKNVSTWFNNWTIWGLKSQYVSSSIEASICHHYITQLTVACLKSCSLIVYSKYRTPLTHGLTLVPSWFRPAAGRLLDAHSLTVSAPSAALPPAVPHPKQTAFIPFIHWHSPRKPAHTHLPPLESAHCSTEPVKGITYCKIKLLSYFTSLSGWGLISVNHTHTQTHTEEKSQGLLDQLYFRTNQQHIS